MRFLTVAARGALALIVASSVTAAAPGRIATALAPTSPVVTTGRLPASYDLDDIEVELVPDIDDQTEPGPLPTYFVDPDLLSLDDARELTVRLPPSEVPADFVSADGLVRVKVDGAHDGHFWSTIVSAQVATSAEGSQRWVDPADHSRPRTVPRFDRPIEMSSSGITARASSGRCPDGGSGPHQTEYLERKRLWSTVGTSYPVGRSTAWMTVTTDSENGSRYGSAVKYAGISATVTGSAWARGSWSKTWNPSGAARSYRKEVEYLRVRYYGYLAGPACDHVHWVPNQETGGTATNRDGVTRPDWREPERCAKADPGPFVRASDRGSNYEYGAAVKAAEVLGIDLSISRAYSSHQSITYQIRGGGHWLCGNNGYPSVSGKLMEWRARPF